MEDDIKANYFAIIPAYIRYNKELKLYNKIIGKRGNDSCLTKKGESIRTAIGVYEKVLSNVFRHCLYYR